MNQFVKSMMSTSITTALTISALMSITSVNAATYQVVDKGDVSQLERTYAQKENHNGEMAISGTKLYNFPVQFQYLDQSDFDSIKIGADLGYLATVDLNPIEDFDALVAGDPTANDLEWVLIFLRAKATDFKYQKIGDAVAMTNLGGTASTEEYLVFDQAFEGTSTLTRSTRDIIAGITDAGIAYGTGTSAYLPIPFTDSSDNEVTFWLRDFSERGFFSFDYNSPVIPVIPDEIRHGGGISTVTDVNDNSVVTGYMSYKLNQAQADKVTDTTGGCADPNIIDDQPFDICVQKLQNNMYHIMAFSAFADINGDVTKTELGLLVSPHENDTRVFSSFALSINNNDIAVGYADGWNDETVTTNPDVDQRSDASYAVVFKNGEVIDFNGEHKDSFNSKAYDISNSGFAVGHTFRRVNGKPVRKFFYVDTNATASDMLLTTPVDFFTSSNSTARAVNDAGLVVGEGEVETHVVTAENPRRKDAFLYDINVDSFTNINDLLACESPYNIIEARDINNNNEISATAIITVDRRDAKGDYVLDENGDRLTEDVVRAVSLVPVTDGTIEDCSKVEEKIQRAGSFGGYLLVALLMLTGFRRKTSQ